MSRSAPTLVCFALPQEAGAFTRKAANRKDLMILVTGMGRQNSERKLIAQLAQGTPELVLTCGFAGGLDPTLALGEVLGATTDEQLRQRLTSAGVRLATFLCAARIASTRAEKERLRRTTMADAVEMESAAIQGICHERGIPCATVRVISDAAHENLPLDFNQLAKPDLRLDYGKLLWAVAKSPGKIPALLRLQKNSTQAAQRLAETLVRVLPRD